MLTREQLKRLKPSVETATARYVRGDISRAEYERDVAEERKAERKPPAEQTASKR